MLNYSDLTVVRNNEGLPTALGYTVNSLLMNSNNPLFVGGGGRKKTTNANANADADVDFEHLAVPAGLMCMTETICTRQPQPQTQLQHQPYREYETIPDGLYEKLMALAETKAPKKLSRNKNMNKQPKNKTNKHKRKRKA